MPDHSTAVRQLIEKLLLHRGRRSAVCHVFAPSGGAHLYSVVLEESGLREQFYLQPSHVEQFVASGNQQNVLPDIRAGLKNLERIVAKRQAVRSRSK